MMRGHHTRAIALTSHRAREATRMESRLGAIASALDDVL